ncbi:MCE family protein [Nocardia sp. NPDC005825]|uniref:MCE family protein n=1 Tax=unclassified Nocardia TaxID=2637762 RepID=UPI0033C23669
MNTRHRRVAGLAIGVAVALSATGCDWDGLNTVSMPGSVGTGSDAWHIKVQMPNVTTLTRNSPVLVNDVTVGTVTGIDVENWHALVTIGLDKNVKLPANAVAKIGQTSLLGSNHVELASPTDVPATGELHDGDTITLDRAGVFPTTEQTLSSLSVVLNGGGISQLENITHELNTAFTGRTDAIRDLLPQLNQMVGTLNAQTTDIINAMSGLDRLSGTLAQEKDRVAGAIDNIHPALTVLANKRENITNALTAVGDLSDVVKRIIDNTGDDLKAEIADLGPTLEQIANTSDNFSKSLNMMLTFPFPFKYIDRYIRGDYMNVKITFDITAARLDSNFLTGTPLGGRFGGVEGALGQAAGVAGDQGDPGKTPLQQTQPSSTQPSPTVPGLPGLNIPGLPSIPGITVPQGDPGK